MLFTWWFDKMVRIISEHFVLVNFTYWWSPLWWSVASGCGLFPCQWPISSKWVWSQCKWLIDGRWVWSVSVSMANQWQVGTVVCFRQGWWWVSICGGLIHCAMAVNHFNVWYCQFQFAVAWSILFYSTVFISSDWSQFGVLGPLEVHAGGFDTYVAIQLYCFV